MFHPLFSMVRSCRVATTVMMGTLAGAYAVFALVVVGTNVAGPGQDWLCMALAVVGAMGIGEAVFVRFRLHTHLPSPLHIFLLTRSCAQIYAYFPPQHTVMYEPA
jgi:hypothetical protein